MITYLIEWIILFHENSREMPMPSCIATYAQVWMLNFKRKIVSFDTLVAFNANSI